MNLLLTTALISVSAVRLHQLNNTFQDGLYATVALDTFRKVLAAAAYFHF